MPARAGQVDLDQVGGGGDGPDPDPEAADLQPLGPSRDIPPRGILEHATRSFFSVVLAGDEGDGPG